MNYGLFFIICVFFTFSQLCFLVTGEVMHSFPQIYSCLSNILWSGASKRRPTAQAEPSVCFCAASELRIVLMFSKGHWENKRERKKWYKIVITCGMQSLEYFLSGTLQKKKFADTQHFIKIYFPIVCYLYIKHYWFLYWLWILWPY